MGNIEFKIDSKNDSKFDSKNDSKLHSKIDSRLHSMFYNMPESNGHLFVF
jgi:Txe/YoeB family toxin of Txe-Axe toxin-antitoxin module